MTACPVDGNPLAAPTPPGMPPLPGDPSKGLAIASLVMGILSVGLCFGPLLGIPAVICGHIALSKSKKYPGQSGARGFAIVGLVTGYIGIVMIVFLAGLLLPALAKGKEKAVQIHCVNNLKQIGVGTRLWANDHGNILPHSLVEMSNELVYTRVLVCPGDPERTQPPGGSIVGWDAANVSYELLTPGMPVNQAQNQVIVRCPIHGTELRGDGSVTRVKTKR